MSLAREAELQLVTPLFLGETDPRGALPDLVRPPAVKGALRFWWRALAWARWGAQAQDPASRQEVLNALRAREGELFGAVAPRARQSRVLLQVTWLKQPGEFDDWPRNPVPGQLDGSTYLGWGIVASGRGANAQPHRTGWREGGSFRLVLQFAPRTDEAVVDEVCRALEAWSLFGGLGARSRRGFGSVALTTLDGQSRLLETLADYKARVRSLLEAAAGAPEPPYTAFSRGARWAVVVEEGKDPRETHRRLGEAYRTAVGQVGAALRPALGLPIPARQLSQRRASPLLLHIHPLATGDYVGAALWLPSDPFLPDGMAVDLQQVREGLGWFQAEGGQA
ncbi:Type III-B CRISPR module RAMP protein Cmr1 [Candidatus Hydrogenisulfobacillus filiaventi]|uniref:Type III-B CRISPR module RAMP protein Cmr1 n=1 Tax=Candidatus Hydrogenisulfobacillus filiaventi TaxID=2707344 RepID=A0A6F8ZDN3_9FIRM|nr:Type III-B CRISPR module RAMP protein Cmr1 [Candidatus Hydrogenisulfobacillus filiaventi]